MSEISLMFSKQRIKLLKGIQDRKYVCGIMGNQKKYALSI